MSHVYRILFKIYWNSCIHCCCATIFFLCFSCRMSDAFELLQYFSVYFGKIFGKSTEKQKRGHWTGIWCTMCICSVIYAKKALTICVCVCRIMKKGPLINLVLMQKIICLKWALIYSIIGQVFCGFVLHSNFAGVSEMNIVRIKLKNLSNDILFTVRAHITVRVQRIIIV